MAWQVSPKAVEWHHETETNIRVGLRAENIRTTQTGLHAKISVLQNTYPISYDTFNVERHADRIRLINASFPGFVTGEVSKPEFSGYVHQFCQTFWEKWSDQYAVEDVGGDPELAPRCFLLEPYILAGAGTILFGPPGRGKSTLALLMAQSINAGIGQFWRVTPAPALYVNLERSKESIQRRLTLVNIQLGLEPEFPLPMANARGRSLVDVLGSIERAVGKRGIRVVFLDSITRGGYGSLIADDIANKIMDGLNGMCESWVGLAHTPRGDDTHAFGCHDDQTEILTRKGWIRFPEWKGEAVLTLDIRRGKSNFAYVKPTAYHEYDYDGPMLELESPSLNACVTPNHRMLVWDKQGKKRWLEAGSLSAEVRLPFARAVQTSSHQVSSVHGFPIQPLARLVGIVVSEGSFVPGAIQIAQATKRAGFVRKTLEQLGLYYKVYEYEPTRAKDTERMAYFSIRNSGPLLGWMRRNCGKGAENKRLPSGWQRWPVKAQQELLEALMWGDGWWQENRAYGVYTTISSKLADDVQALAITLGWGAAVNLRAGGAYTVQIWYGRRWRWLVRKRHVSSHPYSGKVYCFTMPTETLVTRRKGRTAVTGNSQMFDAAADMTVQLLSQRKLDGTLGVGLQVTKANDIAFPEMAIWALEFDRHGLSEFRVARHGEFPDVEGQKKMGMADQIHEHLLNIGQDDATSIATELGFSRQNVSQALAKDARFSRSGRDGHRILYAVLSDEGRQLG